MTMHVKGTYDWHKYNNYLIVSKTALIFVDFKLFSFGNINIKNLLLNLEVLFIRRGSTTKKNFMATCEDMT